MSITATVSGGFTTVSIDGYDRATDALDKTDAILLTLSASFDDEQGFTTTDHAVWLTLLAARDLVSAARSSLVDRAQSAA